MQPYINNIEKEAMENNYFRKEIFTGTHMQMTVMSLDAGEDIGVETHPHIDQFLRVEQGSGIVSIDDKEYSIENNFGIIIPAGSKHNVTNTGDTTMKLYSIYTPPAHPVGTIHKDRAEAYNENLANGIGNLASRLLNLGEKNLDAAPVIPEMTIPDDWKQAMEEFRLDRACDIVWRHSGGLDVEIAEKEPFKLIKTDPEAAKEILRGMLVKLYTIARILNPILPEISKTIKA